MPAFINASNVWRSVASLYIKTSTGGPFSNGWRTVTDGYVKVGTTGGPFSNGWRRIFSSVLTPSIAFPVEISRNNATYPSTLTGTNYNWTNSTSLTYVFQKSSDNVNFTDIGSPASISNPSVGSSNTVTYALTLSDFPAFTSYFRFVVTGFNSTYSTSFTSTSGSVSVNRPAPINTVAPVISPTSGTVGVTTYSVVSNGTWNPDDADGVYEYLWQSFDTPSYISAPGTNNQSTYTPPSNFLTLGYQSPIRCRVTATNASGSTAAFSNTATVSPVAPSASNLATSDSTITPGTPSSITVANTATTNQGIVNWTNGANATSAWVSSVTPGSSYTGTDGGSLLRSQLFTITSTATAVATVNNKNNNKRVTISWNQSNTASYRVNYTITNAGAANGTFNQDGNSSASSASFIVTLGNVSGTVRANSVTVYSSTNQTGVSSTFTPGSAPQTSPTDKTSSNTGSGSITFTTSPPVNTVAPSVSPTSGTAGSTTYSCTTGSWTNSPTSYAYQWQYNDQGATFLNISGATSSTYSPPSNFFSFYVSPIRCRVTATNAGGSTQAFSNTASVSAPLSPPSGGSVSLSGTGVANTAITATTTGWSGSPTSYNLRIYASTSNPPTTSSILKASSSSSSVSYTVTTSDAAPPAYYFKAFATATNAAGTSSEVGSNVILSSPASTPTPATPTGVTNTYNGGTSYTFSWNASSGATGYFVEYGENSTAPSPNPPSSIVGNIRTGTTFVTATSYSFTSLSSSNYVGFRVAAYNASASPTTSAYSAVTQYK